MKPAPFEYIRPANLDEAVRLLASESDETMAIAGGQSLMPLLALRMTRVDRLVDIGRLDALRQIDDSGSKVIVGAGITHAEIEDGRIPDPGGGLMRRIAGRIAYRAIRNQGTIGGSVALADPAADWPAGLIAMDAVALIRGPKGDRAIPVNDLIESTFTTRLARGELIVAFEVPRLSRAARVGVAKVARKTGAFSMSLVVVVADGKTRTRIVLGGAGARPSVLRETSTVLAEAKSPDNLVGEAISRDLASIDLEMDAYSSRLHTATILRALTEVRPQ